MPRAPRSAPTRSTTRRTGRRATRAPRGVRARWPQWPPPMRRAAGRPPRRRRPAIPDSSLQMLRYGVEQRLVRQRLGDVVVGALLQPPVAVAVLALAADENHFDVAG